METELLKRLAGITGRDGLAPVVDLRTSLATNAGVEQWRRRDTEQVKGFVWHQGLSWGSVEGVARYHTGHGSHLHKGGVASIAYTWAIRRNGQIVLCNDFDKKVWSQGYLERDGDENAEFMSVMFEGFFRAPTVTDSSAGEPTREQISAGLLLWSVCRESWRWKDSDLYGHYHFGKPACPGNTMKTIIEAVRFDTEETTFDLSGAKGRQEALKKLGYYKGKADGSWGPLSKGALLLFQVKYKLVADGIWGPKTEAAIMEGLKE